jgi:hypothetical protein
MTQKQEILKHLQTFGTITTMQACDDYDITRLSARVYDLRQDGYLIENKRVNYKAKNGRNKHYDIYIYRGRVA